MTNRETVGAASMVYIHQHLELAIVQFSPSTRMFLILLSFLISVVNGNSDPTAAIRMAVCSKGFSTECLKLDLLGLVAKGGGSGSYQLLPGVVLSHNLSSVVPSEELLRAVQGGNSSGQDLDSFLSAAVSDYLGSVTLSVKLLDQSAFIRARSLSNRILAGFLTQESGRRKGYGSAEGGALWGAGMLATLGMAALAAVSGKAMMTSMLALTMAGVTTFKNSNGCNSKSHMRAIKIEKLEPEIHSAEGQAMSSVTL